MLKLYKNKKTIFECKIEIEGADYTKIKPRMIFFPSNDTRNVFFEGVIEGNTCKIPINPNLDIPKTGKVMIEVILDDTTLFQPWETNYEIVVEQAKIQTESIKLTLEPTKPSIKIVENTKTIDDKNKIIEPVKSQPKIVEVKKEIPKKIEEKKSNKKELFLESVSDNDKNIINEFLLTVNSLGKNEKKVLLEHISKTYKPNNETTKWAKSVFVEQNVLATKIAMYCHQLETEKASK